MNKNTTIYIIIGVGVFGIIGMLLYYRNKRERDAEIFKQKQLEALAAAGADIKIGVDWGDVISGLGNIATTAGQAGLFG